MKRRTRMLAAWIACIALLGSGAGCSAPSPDPSQRTARQLAGEGTCYATTELGLGEAIAINEHGQVLVTGDTPADSPFLWDEGKRTPLGSHGGIDARALNDRGQVVGSQNGHAFRWKDGEMTDLGTLGGTLSWAIDVDRLGRVIGDAQTAGGDAHAFLWNRGEMLDLGTLGGKSSHAVRINARGWVVGDAQTAAGETHAFLWKRGKMHDLGTLGGISSTAIGINRRGEIAGTSLTTDGQEHAFFWADGEMVDLGTLGGPTSHADAINEDGRIVGWSTSAAFDTDPKGHQHAFVWDYDALMTDLGPPGADGPRVFIDAVDINQGGEVVVHNMINPGTATLWASFVWDDGVRTQLGDSQPNRINDAGQIIGLTRVGLHAWNARLWDPIDCPEQH